MSSSYRNDADYDYLFKILIIGDSGVGKTTILQRFTQDLFSNEYVATIGVDFQIRNIEVGSKRCRLQVWDTAGQDRFKSVVGSYYRNAHGVVICFDLTDLESFRNVNNWYEEVQRFCPPKTPVYLIGTKSDLNARRTVTEDMIKPYIEKNHLSYLETSSKTNENVKECFIDFTRILIERTNRIELTPKEEQIKLSNKSTNVNSGCFGGNKCTI